MAIDETGLINWDLYTIILNKEAKWKRWAIAAFIRWTKSSTVVDAVYDKMNLKQLIKTDEVTLDLSNTMNWIASQIFPWATHTYDRFHVQKLVTDAVQTIRIRHRWIAIEEENDAKLKAKDSGTTYKPFEYSNWDTKKQLLARWRYLLYKSKKKWSKSQEARSKILFEAFPEIHHAYNYSMYFRNCYEKPDKYSFTDWITSVNKTKLKELKAAATSIERHLPWIMNYFHNKSTNANIESFNAKLKLFRQNTRWVKDKNFFIFRVLKYFA